MNRVLNGFSYPIYAVDYVGCGSVVVAGGGGAVRTGVPNRIDVVNLDTLATSMNPRSVVSPVTVKVDGGVDTGTEAVMNLTVASAGWGAFVITVEGRRCIEYLARLTKLTRAVDHEIAQTDVDCDEMQVRKRSQTQNNESTNTCLSKTISASSESANQVTQKWELVKLRTFSLPSIRGVSQRGAEDKHDTETGLLTCVAGGGRAGSLVALGTDSGRVFLVDRQASWNPLILYPDVSVGLSAGVCSLSLTSSCASERSDTVAILSSVLLATVCDQPSWNSLSVWRTDRVHNGTECSCVDLPSMHPQATVGRSCERSLNSLFASSSVTVLSDLSSDTNGSYCSDCSIRLFPYAMASCSVFSHRARSATSHCGSQVPKTSESSIVDGDSYRFKHCQFLKSTTEATAGFFPEAEACHTVHMLAATVQPLRANRRSVSRLSIWLVPLACRREHTKVIGLPLFAETPLPRGHLPACLASHPNPERPLIGVGTMDGHVAVYFLSCSDRSLTCVYSMDNAHPIFVTALAFLPLSSHYVMKNCTQSTLESASPGSSFGLVSVSVDRAIRHHSGPSYIRIGQITRGLHNRDIGSHWQSVGYSLLISFSRLVALFLLPVFLALLDIILMWIL